MTLRLDPIALCALSRTLSEAAFVADHGPIHATPHAAAS